MRPEGAGQPDTIDALDAQFLHQQAHTRIQRRLRELDRTHIGLGDGERHRSPVEHIGESAVSGFDAITSRGEAAVDHTILVDDAGEVHLGDHLDDARPADARDTGRLRGLCKARVVRPEVAADDLEARLERHRIDAHALDGPGRRALAAADLRALKSRTGRARAREQACTVAEHDLGIGADIDQQRHRITEIRTLSEDHAGCVGADVARDARQNIDPCVRVHFDAERGGGLLDRLVGGERERCAAEFGRIETEY